MSLSSAAPPPALVLVDEGGDTATATGILMVRYQLTRDQAMVALQTRARNAGRSVPAEAAAVVAEQDAAARAWGTGPETGVLDRRRPDLVPR